LKGHCVEHPFFEIDSSQLSSERKVEDHDVVGLMLSSADRLIEELDCRPFDAG
jgi:hypothetical protein